MIRNKYIMNQLFEGKTPGDIIFGIPIAPEAPPESPSPSPPQPASSTPSNAHVPAPSSPVHPIARVSASPSSGSQLTLHPAVDQESGASPTRSPTPVVESSSSLAQLLGGGEDMEDTLSVDKMHWPAWLRESYELLFGEGSLQGTLWIMTVNNWTRLEGYYGFENPIGSVGSNLICALAFVILTVFTFYLQKSFFGALGHPEAVHWWLQNAKPSNR